MPAGRAMSASDHSLASRWRLRMAPSVARTCSAVSLWANAICSAQNSSRCKPPLRWAALRQPLQVIRASSEVRGVQEVLAGPLYLLPRAHDLDQLLAALGWPDHDRAHQPVVHEEQLPEEALLERVGPHRLEVR